MRNGMTLRHGGRRGSGFSLCLMKPENVSAGEKFIIVLRYAAGESVVKFASEELARYCGKIFNREFKIAASGELSEEEEILKGASKSAGPALEGDEYEISRGGGRIILRGASPRALLFSVYDFLETFLGCRWYYPSPEDQIVPARGIEKLYEIMDDEAGYRKKPDFEFREREYQGAGNNLRNAVHEVDWWAKMRMNALLFNWSAAFREEDWKILKEKILPEIKKRGLYTGLAEHGAYSLFLSPEKYFDKHPEWFCLKNGERTFDKGAQFCTENPEALEAFLGNFRAFARENPEFTFYYPAPNDKGGWCECGLCSKKPVGDRYLELDNKIALALSEVNKDIKVLHLIYGTHKDLPQSKDIRPEPNLILDLALWGRDYSFSIGDKTKPDPLGHRVLLKNWVDYSRKTSAPMIKHCKFMRQTWLGMRLLPLPAMHEDMKHFKKLGFSGFDFPLASVGIWTKALPAYVTSKKCWDVCAGSDEITEEYLKLYYGSESHLAEKACAKEMEAFTNNRYAGYRFVQGNFSISWPPAFWKPEKLLEAGGEPPELIKLWDPGMLGAGKREYLRIMRDSSAFSIRRLNEALEYAKAGMDKSSGVYRERFVKLRAALLQVKLEQEFLRQSAFLAEAVMDSSEGKGGAEGEKARDIYDRLAGTFSELEKNSSPENDSAGLLWFGRKMLRFGEALLEWDKILKQESVL